MHMVLLDPDQAYLLAVQTEIAKRLDHRIRLTIACDATAIKAIPSESDTCYLINECFFLEERQKWLQDIVERSTYAVLVEGTYDELEGSAMEDHRINKFQSIEQLIQQVQEIYLSASTQNICRGKTKSKVIAVFTPYGNKELSRNLSTITTKTFYGSKGSKILILHFDPYQYYIDKSSYLSSISYLLFQSIRKKCNIAYITHEVAIRTSTFVEEIYGPVCMQDLDEIEQRDLQDFMEQLRNNAEYDFILLNLNGIHITSNYEYLLKEADLCLLNEVEEGVCEAIRKQIDVVWNIRIKEEEGILETVLERELKNIGEV